MSAVVTLSIIVVSYNTREMTLACLRSVFDQTSETSFELIVLDNASSDGSADAIEREFGDRVRFIRSMENLGFARANNLAAKEALGEYLLLLNPDTIVLDSGIDRLLEFAKQRPEAGIWGGRTLFGDGALNPTSCWARQTLWSVFCRAFGLTGIFPRSSFFNPEAMGGWGRDTERQVDIVTGCFLLIEHELWRRLDGFDPRFFMYGEEADLCLRARRLGAKPHVTPTAEIIHYGGASERVRADKVVKLLRAKVQLMRRHWSVAAASIGIRFLAIWCATRALVQRMQRGSGATKEDNDASWSEVWYRRREWMNDDKALDKSTHACRKVTEC